MIKVGWENLNNSVGNLKTPIQGCFESFLFKHPENETEQHINYCTNNFLGLKPAFTSNYCFEEEGDLLKKAEFLLEKIFNSKVGLFFEEKTVHLNILDQLVSDRDIVVVDQFVNTNIELAANYLKKRHVNTFNISHHNISSLEDLVKKANANTKVWYLAQGSYPVPGDKLPVPEIKLLLSRYSNLFLYVDDSCSLGWTGDFGSGLIRNLLGERVILTASLSKGFGAVGGIVVISNGLASFADPQILSSRKKNIIKSIISSAEFMLSPNMRELQNRLLKHIRIFHSKAQQYELPIISNPDLPMIFIAAGTPVNCSNICSAVSENGMFISAASYPQLPVNCSGIKINITLKHSVSNIKNLVEALKEAYRQNPVKETANTNTNGHI